MKNGIEEITKHYYTGNHLSSTQLVTDGTGVAVQQVEYAPFGEVVNEYNINWSNGQVPDFKFNGKELDEESGMYYFEARYQRPQVFISRDVMFEKYPMFSPYAYCGNNPVNFIDPDGRYKLPTTEANKSKTFAKYLTSGQMKKDVLNSPTIMNALKTYGQMSEEQIITALSNGKGPTIRFIKMTEAGGEYVKQNNTIYIPQSVIDLLENSETTEQRQGAFLWLISTVLHETVHYGDWLDGTNLDNEKCAIMDYYIGESGKKYPMYKAGNQKPEKGELFESEVYYNSDWLKSIDTLNDAIEVTKSQDAKNKKVIPTIPE